jgi:hypothetical protein
VEHAARQRQGAVAVVAVFVVSRVAVWAAGVDFDTRPLQDSFALVDVELLRQDLVTTLAHLHTQPPLFNLAVGLGLQLGPGLALPAFRLAFLGLGLALALGVYAALVRMGAGTVVATVTTAVLVCSPSVFLYESWFHYDYPVTTLLVLAVVALQRYAQRRRPLDAAVFLGLLATVTLTRSMFHLAWLAGWAAALAVGARHRPRARRAVIAAAVLSVAVVAASYANSLRVSGAFASSTTLGISLGKITTFQLDDEVRRRLVDEGALSPYAAVLPASPLPEYRQLLEPHPPTGVAVLDQAGKGGVEPTTATQTNFNNLDYVRVSEHYLADALRTVRLRPDAYLQGVSTAVRTFFRPPSTFFGVAGNRSQIDVLDRAYSLALLDVTAVRERPPATVPGAADHFAPPPGGPMWVMVGAYVVALAGGAVAVVSGLRRRRPVLVLAFLWSTAGYVTVVGNLLEVGENNRFRLYSDPLVVLLAVALALAWARRRRERRLHREGATSVCHAATVPTTTVAASGEG